MISILSLVTSIKDYVEVLHKLIESDSSFKITNYDGDESNLMHFIDESRKLQRGYECPSN